MFPLLCLVIHTFTSHLFHHLRYQHYAHKSDNHKHAKSSCIHDMIFPFSLVCSTLYPLIVQHKWLEQGCGQAICICASVLPLLHMLHLHLLKCSISLICRCSSFILFLCYAESLLLHRISPSFIDVCLVLFCSALSSLLLLLLHPVSAACTWGLLCFQLCLSLPLQEWTSRSTFRSVRKRNGRGSTADTG